MRSEERKTRLYFSSLPPSSLLTGFDSLDSELDSAELGEAGQGRDVFATLAVLRVHAAVLEALAIA